ncbi:hypothetical protein SUGI_0642090 [Cryptomeria japonica]|nr:hypothetical protein SUGI_0642090 [Cryptomeria japonica]
MQSNSAREARRRKILERSADRLAFISGDRKSFEPIQPPSYSILHGDSSAANGGLSGETIDEPSVDVSSMNGSHLESHQDNSKANGAPDFGVESESSTVIASDSSRLVHQAGDKKRKSSSLFTVSRFSHAIDASENARALCSLGIAIFLVIHSFLLATNNPLGAVIDRFVPPWPVSLLIGTDLTLVMAIMLTTSKGTNPMDATGQPSKETYPIYPMSGVWKLIFLSSLI